MFARRAPLRTACTLTVSLLVLPAVAGAQKPNKPNKPATVAGPVSISVKPAPVVFGNTVAVTGTVKDAKSGVVVTLQSRPATGGSFATIGNSATDNGGRYSLTDRPSVNVVYRVLAATAPAQQSGDLALAVRPLVGARVNDATPRKGSLVRFTGIVRPRHDGRVASIQKLSTTGRWFTVARTTLRAYDARTSRYNRRVRIRSSGSYRVRVTAHNDHAHGISRTVTLTVH